MPIVLIEDRVTKRLVCALATPGTPLVMEMEETAIGETAAKALQSQPVQ